MGVGVTAASADLVRYHDMCVVGLHGLFEHGVVPEPRDGLERLVSQGVRPILAVAEQYRPIRRVLVASSGSLESAKTFKHFVHSGLYADVAEVPLIGLFLTDAGALSTRAGNSQHDRLCNSAPWRDRFLHGQGRGNPGHLRW